MDKLDLILARIDELAEKLDALINAIAQDEPIDEAFDFDGNSCGIERDTNQEL